MPEFKIDKDQNCHNDTPTKNIIAVWRAVITQSLMDAGSRSKKKEAVKAKKEAIKWLYGKSLHFYTVCCLANLDPNYVLEKANESINRGCIWRNDKNRPVISYTHQTKKDYLSKFYDNNFEPKYSDDPIANCLVPAKTG